MVAQDDIFVPKQKGGVKKGILSAMNLPHISAVHYFLAYIFTQFCGNAEIKIAENTDF